MHQQYDIIYKVIDKIHTYFEYIFINSLVLKYIIKDGFFVENKEPNKQENSDKKSIIFFFLIAASVVFGFFIFPDIYDKYESRPVVVYTLSKEQLDGYGYTEKGGVDIDIWESDSAEDTESLGGTSSAITEAVEISDLINSEDTCVTVTFPLNINTASVEELIMVRGIGEITANKIVDYRGINGYFYSMDELLNVDGIGKKKLAALNGYLYIDYDSLPETLPHTVDYTYDTEADTIIVTTIPPESTEIIVTIEKSAVTEEELIMNTEDFVTDVDEFDMENSDSDIGYLRPEMSDFFEITEPEYYPDFPIELNSADVRDLTYINGVGESTANKIVEYARNIGFTTIEDLLNISGIGKSKLETIRPYVYVISNGVTDATYVPEFSDIYTSLSIEPCEIYNVNINICNKDDLMQLPGIDEKLAHDIIELRTQIGYFKNIEELSFVLSNEKLSEIWTYIFV